MNAGREAEARCRRPPGPRERRRHRERQRVHDVSHEMGRRLELDRRRHGGAPDPRQQLPCALDAALRPAALLDLHRAQIRRQLGGDPDVVPVDETPARELGAVAEVDILGQRVALPTPRRLHARLAPHSAGAVEVEEEAGAVSRFVLDREVRVEEERLGSRQPARIGQEVIPGRLHRPHAGVRERGEQLPDQLRRRNEIRVQHEQEVAAGEGYAVGERAGLVPLAGSPPHMPDVDPAGPPFAHPPRRDRHRLVVRIVEQLDFEAVRRIAQTAGGVDEPFDDVGFVEDGQLYRDDRERALPGARFHPGGPAHPQPEQAQPMRSEGGEEREERQVRQWSDLAHGRVPLSSVPIRSAPIASARKSSRSSAMVPSLITNSTS